MKKKVDLENYFTPRQAAEHFNLSLSTVKNYIYAGKLKTLKTPGGHHRIRKSELLSTLGDTVMSKEDKHGLSLMMKLCSAMLALFRTLGPAGKSFMLHAQKVSELSMEIARAMAMSESDIRRIEMAGLIHDIGYMGIERRIISRSGMLTPQEYELVKPHPSLGKEMLDSIEELKDIADIVGEHHERMDGRGYPKRLMGSRIQKGARIISIAEAYDAMTSPYSYKDPISKDMAIAELMQHRGTQFDGDIVELFTKII